MDRWAGKVVLVTGASAGIGQVISATLVRHGLKVVGVARRLEIIQELEAQLADASGKLYPMKCDLRNEEDILRVFNFIESELGGVDILINNAGVLIPGPITDSPTEAFRKILDVNVLAAAICIRETVRSLKRRKTPGHIINLNSLAGHFAEGIQLQLTLYPASKYALTALTMGVHTEITQAKLDIKITSISPGAVDTDMIANAGIPEPVLKEMPMLKSDDIVDAVVYALSTPPGTLVREIMLVAKDRADLKEDSTMWTRK